MGNDHSYVVGQIYSQYLEIGQWLQQSSRKEGQAVIAQVKFCDPKVGRRERANREV